MIGNKQCRATSQLLTVYMGDGQLFELHENFILLTNCRLINNYQLKSLTRKSALDKLLYSLFDAYIHMIT